MALGLVRGQAIARGKYVLVDRLGEGGMAEVWEAKNTRTLQHVAIKLLKDWETAAGRDRKRFLLEATRAVRHDHIVFTHNVEDLESGIPFLVMEKLVGKTLRAELLDHGALELPRTANVLGQVISAVSALHAARIVHRDLKPANIFLEDRGPGIDHAKVLDFGIAKRLSGHDAQLAPDLTGTQEAFGTSGYMAPEQMESTKSVGLEADVWSLGIILFECLSGQHPWLRRVKGSVDVDWNEFGRAMGNTAPLVEERLRGVPTDVRDAILAALSPSAARRISLANLFTTLAAHASIRLPPFTKDEAIAGAIAPRSEPSGALAGNPSAGDTTKTSPNAVVSRAPATELEQASHSDRAPIMDRVTTKEPALHPIVMEPPLTPAPPAEALRPALKAPEAQSIETPQKPSRRRIGLLVAILGIPALALGLGLRREWTSSNSTLPSASASDQQPPSPVTASMTTPSAPVPEAPVSETATGSTTTQSEPTSTKTPQVSTKKTAAPTSATASLTTTTTSAQATTSTTAQPIAPVSSSSTAPTPLNGISVFRTDSKPPF